MKKLTDNQKEAVLEFFERHCANQATGGMLRLADQLPKIENSFSELDELPEMLLSRLGACANKTGYLETDSTQRLMALALSQMLHARHFLNLYGESWKQIKALDSEAAFALSDLGSVLLEEPVES